MSSPQQAKISYRLVAQSYPFIIKRNIVFLVFVHLVEDLTTEETRWSLKSDTNILTTILKNCHNENSFILLSNIFKVRLLEIVYIVNCSKTLNLLDILRNVA